MPFVLQNGWSPLNAASRNGHLDVVETLLEAGANINQADKDGRTSLDLAVERGHNETVQLLKTYQAKFLQLQLTHQAQLANERARIAEERATRIEQELSETKLHYEALLQQADEKAKIADKRANQELLETKQHYDALQQQIRLQVQLSEERATRAEQELLEMKRQRDAMQQQTRLQVQNADERARRAEERASTAEKEHLETKQQEMHMAASVRHPNLLLFIGASLDDNKPVILTELMPTNLRSIIVALPQDHVITIGIDVARGLNYLHLMRPDPIIHRDVSSAHVLLEPIGPGNWKAKVSDYGSANFLSNVITMGPGNASYAAPESFNPKLQSPKMDVYSYGILLLEMATGQFPDHRLQAMQLDTLPWQEMAMMIRRCICDDPASRPTMKDLLPDLTDLDK
ncbi:hypothetical protein EMCRGX_G005022 [Ephydatia muelleri]